jgi:xanthine dehydrogenase YagR molybdenum-binding subunit
MGARGSGEIGITGMGAAVASAAFNATGKRMRVRGRKRLKRWWS